jgi:hypothetical protein
MQECEKPVHAKGLCKDHYQQAWRTGSPEIVRRNPHGTPEERFWRYVEKKGLDECWLWTGQVDKDGYGWLRLGKSMVRAHRFSFVLHGGVLAEDQLLRHKCNTPGCVNPRHVIPGSHDANMKDRLEAGHYATGQDHPAAKFSDEIVEQVRGASGTYEEISKRFGISISQVGNIKRGSQRKRDDAGTSEPSCELQESG